jgi:hypothetical protein
MKTKSILIALTVLVGGGCKDDGTGPVPTPTSGRATIDSRYVNSQASGFSFDQAGVVRFPSPQGNLPDICVSVQMNNPGEIVGVYLTRPDSLVPTFRLLRQFVTIDSAESYFQGLAEIPDTTYVALAIPTSEGQVWAVKTRRTTFAKVLVRHTLAYADSSGQGAPTPYGEATFDWAYQPNGTRQF